MNRFKRILCVAGPAASGNSALKRAVALARNNHAELSLVDVVPRVTAGIGMPAGGPASAALQAAWVK